MTIGERIKEARKSKGLSQSELGQIIGVQNSAISKYEKGVVTTYSRDTIEQIAKALGVTPAYLYGCSERDEEIANFIDKFMIDRELVHFLNDYISLSAEGQNTVKSLVKTLKDLAK